MPPEALIISDEKLREVKRKLYELYNHYIDEGIPREYSKIKARQAVMRSLMAEGMSNAHAVYTISEIKRLKNESN